MTRGEIYLVDLSPAIGSEQSGVRPVIIVQNDVGNQHSPTVMVCPLTSSDKKYLMPTHVLLTKEDGVLRRSVCLCEQMRTIDKSRLIKKLGEINNPEAVVRLNNSVAIAAGLV